MARKYKCKCKASGKELTTDIAYRDEKGKYYCSQEEYEEIQRDKQRKEECFKYLEGFMRVPISKIARKRINELHEYYSYEVIYRTIKFVEDRIRYAVENKSFNSEQAMVNYLIAIIENNANIVLKEYEKEIADFQKLFEEPKNDIDLDILNSIDETPKGKPRVDNDISEWLDD